MARDARALTRNLVTEMAAAERPRVAAETAAQVEAIFAGTATLVTKGDLT